MSLYTLALFVHVSGARGTFVSLGIWLFGLAALRRARRVEQVRALSWLIIVASPVMVLSVLLLGLAGFKMALSSWGLSTPWIAVSLVSVVLIGPIGAFVLDPRMRTILAKTRELPDGPLSDALFRQVHEPILHISLFTLVTLLLGIVFLMVTKPSLLLSPRDGDRLDPWPEHFAALLGDSTQTSEVRFTRGARGRSVPEAEPLDEAVVEWNVSRARRFLQRKKGASLMWTRSGSIIRARGERISCPAGREPTDEGIASSGITFHLWRLYQHAWLVCLLFPFASLLHEPLPAWRLIWGLLALLFFAASYTWLMWPHPASQEARARTRHLLSFLLFGILGILTVVFSLAYGPAWFWLFIGVSAIAGVLLPMRSAFAAVVLFTLLPLFLVLKMHGGLVGVDVWWLVAFLLLVRGLGVDMIGVARMGSAIQELHAARRELARLAVIEERERLSRDLHDLLGQTLSTTRSVASTTSLPSSTCCFKWGSTGSCSPPTIPTVRWCRHAPSWSNFRSALPTKSRSHTATRSASCTCEPRLVEQKDIRHGRKRREG